MRIIATVSTLILSLGLLAGCTSMSGGAGGALIGGLTGAGIGAIAGDPTAGALLGTGIGMGAGALIGGANAQQRRDNEGWVYDDVWGSSGHYTYQPQQWQPAPVYQQPTSYQPVGYQPMAYQNSRYQYTPDHPDRIIHTNQTVHYWNHY